MAEIIIIFGLLGFMLIVLGICVLLAYLEQKNKCEHKWEETERISGTNMFGGLATEVHLKCIKCGDIEKRTL